MKNVLVVMARYLSTIVSAEVVMLVLKGVRLAWPWPTVDSKKDKRGIMAGQTSSPCVWLALDQAKRERKGRMIGAEARGK